ncbi:MAG: hypothetical protein KDA83_13365 [Planctomycetales bacterium]|nr:hypothetical protein [Planctomycetales bacterium]
MASSSIDGRGAMLFGFSQSLVIRESDTKWFVVVMSLLGFSAHVALGGLACSLYKLVRGADSL